MHARDPAVQRTDRGRSLLKRGRVSDSVAAAPVVILGAGLTGLSTALHLPRSTVPAGAGPAALLVERDNRVGGKAKSHRHAGHTFDVTGHWLHLRDERVKRLAGDLFADDELVEIERVTRVYAHGAMLHYPFQANIHGLPLEIVHECLVGLLESQAEAAKGRPAPSTFQEFAEYRFGKGIARHFFVPYNTKLWGMHPDQMTADWVSRFIPQPDPSQIIAGAIGLTQEGLGYNARFLYPAKGGIDHLPERMQAAVERRGDVELRTGSDVEEIDVVNRRIKLTTSPDWIDYGALVSTLPLPELVKRMPGAPPAVREAAGALRWARWRYLDLATRRAPRADYHWVYVPEERLPFFRVGIYSNAMPSMAPKGCGSLYVELTDRDRVPDEQAVVEGLVEMGTIGGADDVAFCRTRDVEYAYVVFDDHYQSARATILDWLEAEGIRSCGRYGAWIYNSMEDSILQGMEAAQWTATARGTKSP